MKLHSEVIVAFLISLVAIQQGLCDKLSTTSGANNWTCICVSSYQGNQSYIKSNCSSSCDCSPGRGTWTCICTADGFPKVAADIHSTSCFSACNCTSGSLAKDHASRNRFSGKVIVIILLSCVTLTTLAFLASVACYVFRKDCPIQTPILSSDRDTSCNSATNLISHKASLISETNVSITSPFNFISGCFRNAAFVYRTKSEILHGNIVQFSYSELECATHKFSDSNLIGFGGSSNVYYGQLKNGRTVAVKRLKAQGGPDADSLFSTEVELLSRLHHCHVVPLLGYCSEHLGKHSEWLLVFEYMPNGNLRDCLDGNLGVNMNWETRVTIAIGAAKGLQYLHEAAAPRILHRDVKSTNILLDKNWGAKITDLGMAKCLRGDGVSSGSSSPARMQGTFGYFAPEYAMVGSASLMSDVFSFGVVLLELITGRRPIRKSTNKGDESLVLWATPRLLDSKRVVSELPDPQLKGNFPEEEMQIMAYLAKECLLLDPDARPTMSEVVQILSTITPDKSRRRNIPVYLFQMSAAHIVTTQPYMAKAEGRAEDRSHPTQLKHEKSFGQSTSYSPPSGAEETDNVSMAYMERLIHLTSKPQSTRILHDDEAVDLTAPRFESFVTNVRSP